MLCSSELPQAALPMVVASRLSGAVSVISPNQHSGQSEIASAAGLGGFAHQVNAAQGFVICSSELPQAALLMVMASWLSGAVSVISSNQHSGQSEIASTAGLGSFLHQVKAAEGFVL